MVAIVAKPDVEDVQDPIQLLKESKLYAALAAAQAAAKSVDKDATNAFHRYSYASSEAMIDEAKRCLAAHGLAVLPRTSRLVADGTRLEPGPDGRTPREVPQLYLVRTWIVAHSGGGIVEIEQTPWPIVPEKGRPLDKATASADTTSLGYFLRSLLQLPRGLDPDDDMDHSSRDKQPPKPAAPRVQAARESVKTAAKARAPSTSQVVLALAASVDAAKTTDELFDAVEAFGPRAEKLPEKWQEILKTHEAKRHAELSGAKVDLGDDEKAQLDALAKLRAQAPAPKSDDDEDGMPPWMKE